MSADDSFIVQFRLASGCLGTMQSTCADRSPQMIETRVAGTEGSVWIDGLGSEVYLYAADGSRALPVDDDLLGGEVSPPPASMAAIAPDEELRVQKKAPSVGIVNPETIKA